MRLTQMATLASPLLQRKKEPEDEQLLKLFWNRAELKKELAKLRREKEKFVDQIRQQETLNLRVQQRLEQMENLLADPLQAANAAIFYQLRGVWQLSRKRLQRLARELLERQQDREQQYALGVFEQQKGSAVAALDEKIVALDAHMRGVQADQRTVEERVAQLRGFWNYFRRRVVGDQVEAIRAALEGIQLQIERLQAERRDKEMEPAPAFAGLSVEGRRNINLAVVAMAQQLLVHFAEHNVAGLAREASVRGLADVAYGSIAECSVLSQNVESVVRRLDAVGQLSAQMRRRAEYLRLAAQYRRDTDTVPVAGSFAAVPLAIREAGEPRPADDRIIPVNVLADEYWDVYSVLLS